jgi:RimJ/RimL family protein N-acetyltransferase
MSFLVVEYNDVYQFDSDTREYLIRNESENNLILGVTKILCDPAQQYFTSHYMYTVRNNNNNNNLRLVAVWTPIYNLCISTCIHIDDELEKSELFSTLQSHLITKNRMMTGLFAQKDDAKLFAKIWSEQCLRQISKPMSFSTKMSERLYELKPIDLKLSEDIPQQQELSSYSSNNNNNTTTTILAKNLQIDRMDSQDYETCLDWMVHFQQESGFYSNVPKDLIRKLNQNRLDLLVKNDCIFTLRDTNTGCIVSMSAVNAETPNGGRVGWVYTPIEHRGKGYSQQCVARMCEKVFREKQKQKMFLFADLANRAANHLYKKIGFKEVCDVDNLSFNYEKELLKSNL